jgi:hypothetical protein
LRRQTARDSARLPSISNLIVLSRRRDPESVFPIGITFAAPALPHFTASTLNL